MSAILSRPVLAVLVICIGCAAAPASASEIAIGVTSGTAPELVRFDTATPGTLRSRAPVTGMLTGESVNGLDMRPATGELFALTSVGRLLLINGDSGEARQLGPPLDGSVFTPGQLVGWDFNPTVDRIRAVSASDGNVRINPLTFLPVDSDPGTPGTQPDTDLSYKATDVNVGANPSVVASAYSNNDADAGTPTTLWGLDSSKDTLIRQGAVDGNAGDIAGGGSPNGGLLTTIGSLGVDIIDASMDITRGLSPAGNVAYAALQPASGLSLMATVDLVTGLATIRGAIGDRPLGGMTIAFGGAFHVVTTATVTSEAAGQVTVMVERAGDTLAAARLGFRTADHTAVAGADYVATSGTLDFAPGERTKQITVGLVQNSASEGVESLALELGPAIGGAVVDTPVHVIEIADDDPVPALVPPQAAADLTRPVFLASPASLRSLTALRRSGSLPVDVACSEACVVRLTLALGKTRVGVVVGSLSAAGVRRLRVQLSAVGRKAIDRARRGRGSASLVLRGTATDSGGNRATRTITLRVARR